MTAIAAFREAPGLDAYLDELEERLVRAVGTYNGVVSAVGGEALAAGGKRLRPLLVYLSSPNGPPPVAAGVAVELVHMATLVHDDLIDRVLADATLCLARGEAMQRSQRHDPETPVEAYLERCSLKTGKLFEAACRLGGGSGAFGLALGIAFQITDDILDCSGVTIETGKVAGTDLREGTPTLPLLLAARQDEAVRAALTHAIVNRER
ncbi:MAG: polyprenyl synthetase family protein [Acidobacteria bacterium]|nr:polyprenyl synthetase family protein [Acidobacteriota bacterium]